MDWADKDGKRINPITLGLPPQMPRDVRHCVTFQDLGGATTEMTVTEFGYTVEFIFELSRAGLEQCLDKMAANLRRSSPARSPVPFGAMKPHPNTPHCAQGDGLSDNSA